MDQHVFTTTPDLLNRISNKQFLEQLFGDQWPRVAVCSLAALPSNGWPTRPASETLAHLPPTANNYYCVSLVSDPFSRRAENFEAMPVLALDDVGTRSDDPEKIRSVLGEPTYRLETSPGNEHWGYRLDPWVTDPDRAGRLQKRVTTYFYAGKDPGHQGVTRVMRLPQGSHTTKRFRCRLLHLDLSKSPLGLSAEFIEKALPLPDDEYQGRPQPVAHDDDDDDDDDMPGGAQGAQGAQGTRPKGRPPRDPVLRGLRLLHLVHGPARKSAGGVGWDITCPWSDEHTPGTGATDTGTMYFRGGGFKCWHGHCEHRGPADVRARVDELLREDAREAGLDEFGLEDLDTSRFDKVDPSSAPASPVKPTTSSALSSVPAPIRKFHDEIVYLLAEDRWLDLTTDTTMVDKALDVAWRERLGGWLPVNARGKAMTPSAWAREESGPAHVHGRSWWPGKPLVFADPVSPGRLLVNTWRELERPLAHVPFAELEAHVRGSDWWALIDAVMGSATWEQRENARRARVYMSMIVGPVWVKPAYIPLIIGAQGGGKEQIWAPFTRVLGPERATSISQNMFNSPFNAWARNRLVLMPEIRRTTRGAATDHDQYQIIKRMCDVGRTFDSINEKYLRMVNVANVFVMVMTSNEDRPMTLPDDDRRIWVIRAQETGWPVSRHVRLARWLDAASPWGETNHHAVVEYMIRYWDEALMLDEVLDYAPMTEDKRELIRLGRDTLFDWLEDRLDRRPPDPLALPDLITARELVDLAEAAIRSGDQGLPRGTKVPNIQGMGILMRKNSCRQLNGAQTVPTANGRRAMWAHRDAPRSYDGMSGPALGLAWNQQRNRRP